jgi:phosphoglycolate phosphatase-like HAD superfamily hydrolase
LVRDRAARWRPREACSCPRGGTAESVLRKTSFERIAFRGEQRARTPGHRYSITHAFLGGHERRCEDWVEHQAGAAPFPGAVGDEKHCGGLLNGPARHDDAYRAERRRKLALYPTVPETLLKIKGTGAAIVGYTESMAFYSNYRVRRLGLDGVFDFMFSPKDHDIPDSISVEDIRKYPASHYEFHYTKQERTPKNSFKPDTIVLLKIIQDLGVDKSECVYVGDSLTKDVTMAQDARVADVYARYGKAQYTDAYALLREVTHWSDAGVEREKRIGEREVQPSTILESNFGEILSHFHFGEWNGQK